MSSDSDSSGLSPPPAAAAGARRARRSRLPPAAVGAAQQVGKPSVAPLVGAGDGTDRRRFGAARRRHAEVRRRQGRGAAGVAHARRSTGSRMRGGSITARIARSMRSAAAPAGDRHHRLFLALGAGAAAAHDVEAAAVMCDDPVQFRQSLDLVDDHLAHLRGAFGGFLRHFQHAAAQLVAGGLEFVCISAAICFMLAPWWRTSRPTA